MEETEGHEFYVEANSAEHINHASSKEETAIVPRCLFLYARCEKYSAITIPQATNPF